MLACTQIYSMYIYTRLGSGGVRMNCQGAFICSPSLPTSDEWENWGQDEGGEWGGGWLEGKMEAKAYNGSHNTKL